MILARRGAVADCAVAALFGAVVMIYLLSATRWLADNDSFYHVKMARLVPELGFVDCFPWLHWTIFRDRFVSHHHGFHVFLSPFTVLSEALTGNLVLGGKLAAVVAMMLTGVLLVIVLRRLGVRHAPLWLLAFACMPWHFWLRMTYIRAPILALPLLLAGLALILANRPIWVGLTAFVPMQIYNGALVLLLLPAAFFAAALVRRESVRPALASAGAITAGLAAGFVLSPYFPANFRFLWTQLFETGLGAPREAGIEWRPFAPLFLLQQSAPLLVLWSGCVLVRIRSGVRLSRPSLALLFLNLLFFALVLKSRRFIEYWPVFALLNAADLAAVDVAPGPRPRPWLVALGIVLVGCVALVNLRFARARIGPSYDPGKLRGAMEFLAQTSPAGSIVFTDDWDIFPYCFFWNHHNRYIVGLDPVFTMQPYPELWERYRLITRGQSPAELAGGGRTTIDDIAGVFEANYVLVAADHPELFRQLRAAPDRFRMVYPPPSAADLRKQPAFAVFATVDSTAPSPRGDAALIEPNEWVMITRRVVGLETKWNR